MALKPYAKLLSDALYAVANVLCIAAERVSPPELPPLQDYLTVDPSYYYGFPVDIDPEPLVGQGGGVQEYNPDYCPICRGNCEHD